MKNSEPMKNVIPIPVCDSPRHCEATPPYTKHADPIENRIAIHQPRVRGRHHTGCDRREPRARLR